MRTALDATDLQILNLLQQDARLEIKQIAHLVHKSASPTHERIRKLQQQGYIKKYVAILDREKIGKPLLAIVQISLSAHTKTPLSQFEFHINHLPQVQACLHLSGAIDFILHIEAADTGAYHDLMTNHISTLPNIHHIETHFVLKETKTQGPYML